MRDKERKERRFPAHGSIRYLILTYLQPYPYGLVLHESRTLFISVSKKVSNQLLRKTKIPSGGVLRYMLSLVFFFIDFDKTEKEREDQVCFAGVQLI